VLFKYKHSQYASNMQANKQLV